MQEDSGWYQIKGLLCISGSSDVILILYYVFLRFFIEIRAFLDVLISKEPLATGVFDT